MAPSLDEIASVRGIRPEGLVGKTLYLKLRKKSRQPRPVTVMRVNGIEHTVSYNYCKGSDTFNNKQDIYEK